MFSPTVLKVYFEEETFLGIYSLSNVGDIMCCVPGCMEDCESSICTLLRLLF